jgi:hypothetical protein
MNKDLLWPMVSEVSAHSQLAPLFSEMSLREGMAEESCSLYSSQEAERERKGAGTRCTLQTHATSDLLPPIRPHLPIMSSDYDQSRVHSLIH